MKLCRFDHNRLGLVKDDEVIDVTGALDVLPSLCWPYPQGDMLITYLDKVLARACELEQTAPRKLISEVTFKAPVANPSKIINAPINYRAHIDEARDDKAISHGRDLSNKNIWDWGLFLKANSSLVGAGEEIALRFPERRNDHEIELVVVIGKACNNVKRQDALNYVAGYTIGLDMTVRGPEFPSFRKSVDTYTVCGPWLVTKDEIKDPGNLNLLLKVNGKTRQDANTQSLIYDVERLIEYASSFYSLLPGDMIFTGTPQGVGPVEPGDILNASIESIGEFNIRVASKYSAPY